MYAVIDLSGYVGDHLVITHAQKLLVALDEYVHGAD